MEDDCGTPDSGFTGRRRIPESPRKKIPRPVYEPNPQGSFIEETIDTITTTKGVDVLEQSPITHDERVLTLQISQIISSKVLFDVCMFSIILFIRWLIVRKVRHP